MAIVTAVVLSQFMMAAISLIVGIGTGQKGTFLGVSVAFLIVFFRLSLWLQRKYVGDTLRLVLSRDGIGYPRLAGVVLPWTWIEKIDLDRGYGTRPGRGVRMTFCPDLDDGAHALVRRANAGIGGDNLLFISAFALSEETSGRNVNNADMLQILRDFRQRFGRPEITNEETTTKGLLYSSASWTGLDDGY
ncbi:hypothetical protein G6N76_10300 [Rhizobium daejeonense]|uniref:Uncharacterized protein n=1 Tax=Rhizobium daejeonense TaxID=240521 RepID=A0A6M1RYX7_9HYPH|nr:hypothetical protein [Rhizobium daejeonense]NGO64065.1 hypothetical protein [Rhizobium daejeonense]